MHGALFVISCSFVCTLARHLLADEMVLSSELYRTVRLGERITLLPSSFDYQTCNWCARGDGRAFPCPRVSILAAGNKALGVKH